MRSFGHSCSRNDFGKAWPSLAKSSKRRVGKVTRNVAIGRRVAHLGMDAFAAAVELLRCPHLRKLPAVKGLPGVPQPCPEQSRRIRLRLPRSDDRLAGGAPDAALAGRIRVRVQLKPVVERERFAQRIQHARKTAGGPHTLVADSGMELLRLASQGLPRQTGRILRAAMRRAVPKALNHLLDDRLQETIEELR